MIMAAINQVDEGVSEADRKEDDRTTRESYKDKHKTEAFSAMRDAEYNLNLHHDAIERAQVLFAVFRDDREKVQKDKLVIAACIIAALREMRLYRANEAAAAFS